MNKLIKVAEGIMDSDACEEILKAGIEEVNRYAENGCDIYLNDDEAERILKACKAWSYNGNLSGTNDYYYNVTCVLSE